MVKIKLELNKAYNISALEGVKLLQDESIQLAILDPPYGNIVKADWDRSNEAFNEDLIRELYRVLKSDGNLYIWCGIGEKSKSLQDFLNLMDSVKKEPDNLNSKPLFHFKDMIVWEKQRGNGGRKGWLQTHELILWYTKTTTTDFIWNINEQYSTEKRPWNVYKKGGKMVNKSPFKRLKNVWTDIMEVGYGSSPKKFKEIRDKLKHFTPKPTDAYERIIKLHTNDGDIILDPFCGSGTLRRACEKIGNRNWIGFDIDPTCIEITNKKIEGD